MKTRLLFMTSRTAVSFSCADSPFSIPSTSILFIEYHETDALNGQGYILFGSGEIDCKQLQDAAESENFFEVTKYMSGVVLEVNYTLQDDVSGEAWLGFYAPSGVVVSDLTVDTGAHGENYYYDYGTRRVQSLWFNSEEGLAVGDSSGLYLELDKKSSDSVNGKMYHQWDNKEFQATYCGSYGA